MYPQEAIRDTTSGSTTIHLVEEIHHRVVNAYAEAVSSLDLAAAKVLDLPSRAALAGAANRLRAHAETHRILLPPAADAVLDLTDYVGRLCSSLAVATLAEKSVRLSVKSDEIWLRADRCWRIGLILTELIRNAARHGLAGRGGEIVVDIASRGSRIRCLVADSGRAVAGAQPGRGQTLVRALAADLGGRVRWRFTPTGSLACLEAPTD